MRPVFSGFLPWLAPLAWMALIFLGSTDLLAANHTSRFLEPFLRWLFGGALTSPTTQEIHFLIRKAGHVCEYAVLCVLFWWALRSPREAHPGDAPLPAPRFSGPRAALAITLAAAFAASDEFHQSFVPTRGANLRDVLVDIAGAALGMLLLYTANRLWRSSRRLRVRASTPT